MIPILRATPKISAVVMVDRKAASWQAEVAGHRRS